MLALSHRHSIANPAVIARPAEHLTYTLFAIRGVMGAQAGMQILGCMRLEKGHCLSTQGL